MQQRDHGGNLDAAITLYGGTPDDWLDLSTGINRRPWQPDQPSLSAWRCLPGAAALEDVIRATKECWHPAGDVLPLAGAQAAIQLLPLLQEPGLMRIVGPTYNEYAGVFAHHGWQVDMVADIHDLAGADIGILVNPNNPDGRIWTPEQIRDIADNVGLLVVDESFGDMQPDLSVAGQPDILVLKSFGKFFGLAGLRLGFAMGPQAVIDAMRAQAGPWQISGIAAEIGAAALADRSWQRQTRYQLRRDAARMDVLATKAGWDLQGGTDLFRLYDVGDAAAVQKAFAKQCIWTRIFPRSSSLLRIGLPGPEEEWHQLEQALTSQF